MSTDKTQFYVVTNSYRLPIAVFADKAKAFSWANELHAKFDREYKIYPADDYTQPEGAATP